MGAEQTLDKLNRVLERNLITLEVLDVDIDFLKDSASSYQDMEQKQDVEENLEKKVKDGQKQQEQIVAERDQLSRMIDSISSEFDSLASGHGSISPLKKGKRSAGDEVVSAWEE